MNASKLYRWFLIPAASTAMAASTDKLPATATELIDTWASVKYCQGIYQEPAVRGRIYEGDLLDCDKSDRLLHWISRSRAAAVDQELLAAGAARKAAAFRHNTLSVQHAVTACREQCRALAAMYDEKIRKGEISGNKD